MLANLREQIQHNCNISDAHFAQDSTLCIYLLRMREYYRWEKHLPFSAQPNKSELSEWITQRETEWDDLIDQPFQNIEISDRSFKPFESTAINSLLAPEKLTYSAGYGRQLKPIFYLGRLERRFEREGFHITVANEEFAREIDAPPAFIQGNEITIRRDAAKRMVWQRYEEWQWREQETRFSQAMHYYDFDRDMDRALEEMTETEIDTMILHEIGEGMATHLLGEEWHEMLVELGYSKAAVIARAVRDHIADTNSTLPELLEQENRPALAAYHANLNGMRAELFPSLGEALCVWQSQGKAERLAEMIQSGRSFWTEIAAHLLALHRCFRKEAGPRIERFMEPLTL